MLETESGAKGTAMHGFAYKNGTLHCEGADLQALAEEHRTPLYVYSAGTLLDHYRRLDQALEGVEHEVAYAVKANSNLSVLRLLANEGAGFDIVSAGELLVGRVKSKNSSKSFLNKFLKMP